MEKKPYHHLPDGSFRNPKGSPERNSNFKWSFKIFNKEKKKLDMSKSKEYVVEKNLNEGSENLEEVEIRIIKILDQKIRPGSAVL